MTDTAVIALDRFSAEAGRIAGLLDADRIAYDDSAFDRAFKRYGKIVAVMSAGIAVRRLAPLLQDKWTDPAVVVVSPDLRYAIPLIGGHHGANGLAKKLAALGITPVISTATETQGRSSVEQIAEATGTAVLNRDSTRRVNAAMLDSDPPLYAITGPGIVVAGPGVAILVKKGEYIVGIGCNKGTAADEIVDVVAECLGEAGIDPGEIMAFATTGKKRHERGLIEAIRILGSNLAFIDDATIRAHATGNPSMATLIGLPGVAEPCALAIAKHKELVLEKKAYGNVTIAIAR